MIFRIGGAFGLFILAGLGVVLLDPAPAIADTMVASDVNAGVVYTIAPNGQKTVLASGFGQPHGLAVDASGNVYVAEVTGDRIWRISESGEKSIFYSFASATDNPEGVAFGPDGALYVSGTIGATAPHHIIRIDSLGSASVYASVVLPVPLGLTFDSTGNLCVPDFGNNGTIWKITPTHQVSTYVSNLGFLANVIIGPDGKTLYAASIFNGNVWRIPSAGQANLIAHLSTPDGLAFDTMGNLYVGQDTQITKIAPDGSSSVFATGVTDVRGLAVLTPLPGSAAAGAGLLGLLIAARLRKGRYSPRIE